MPSRTSQLAVTLQARGGSSALLVSDLTLQAPLRGRISIQTLEWDGFPTVAATPVRGGENPALRGIDIAHPLHVAVDLIEVGSLSIVDATPATARPRRDSSQAAAWDPLPPMTTRDEMSRSCSCRRVPIWPASDLIRSHRVVPRIVPPRPMIPPTSRTPRRTISPAMRPL